MTCTNRRVNTILRLVECLCVCVCECDNACVYLCICMYVSVVCNCVCKCVCVYVHVCYQEYINGECATPIWGSIWHWQKMTLGVG